MSAYLTGAAVFLVGVLARLGLVVAVVAALLAPVALVLGAIRMWQVIRPRLRGLRRIGHVLYKPGARYSAGHTWVERDGQRLRVGLDGVAQELLPWALAVRLPHVGDLVREGYVAAVVSCGGMDARITAPITGKVVAVNEDVLRDPSLVKEDGYGRGWLFAVDPLDTRFATLPEGDSAQRWLEEECHELDRFLEQRLGPDGLAARAGPAPTSLETTDWRDLTSRFLKN